MLKYISTSICLFVLLGGYWIVSYMEYLNYIKYGIM